MHRPTRSIFRVDAVRRYAESREKAVLPQFIAPRTFLWLWLVAALLLVGIGLVWSARVPVYAPGYTVVLDPQEAMPETTSGTIAAVLLPPETLARLQVGQPVFFVDRSSSGPVRGTIMVIEPTIMSPDTVRQRFRHTLSIAQVADRPSVVALARLELPSHLHAAAYPGSRYPIHVAVGARRLLALVPVLGRLVGE